MIAHNKLVRDRIPEIIAARGGRCGTRVLGPEELLAALRAKLAEEVEEYRRDGDPAELADVLEVLLALAEAEGPSRDALEAQRTTKREQRGGFDGRILLVSASP